MSVAESIILTLIVGGAFFFLVRRARQRFGGRGAGCCGTCPAADPKIRLAGAAKRESIGKR